MCFCGRYDLQSAGMQASEGMLKFWKHKHYSVENLISLIVSIVGIAILSVYAIHSLYQRDKAVATELIFESLKGALQNEISLPMFVTENMESDAFLRRFVAMEGQWSQEQRERAMMLYLSGLNRNRDWTGVYFVSSRSRNYYTPQGISKVVNPQQDERDAWYTDFLADGKRNALQMSFDEARDNELTMFVDHRMEDELGDLLGVCIVGVRMENLHNHIAQLESKYGVSIYLTDANGIVKLAARHLADTALPYHVDLKTAVNEIHMHQQGDAVVYYQYVPTMDWYLVVANEQTILNSKGLSKTYITFGVNAMLLLVVVLLVNLWLASRHNATLATQAVTDPLTRLLNRAGAGKRIQECLEDADLRERGGAMFMIDLDHFKDVNDTLGHDVGDEVLQQAAADLRHTFRAGDTLCRLGGDEFLVYSPGLRDTRSVANKAEQLVAQCAHTVERDGRSVCVSVSVGVALFPDHGQHYEELNKKADQALYWAKEAGRNGYRLYTETEGK